MGLLRPFLQPDSLEDLFLDRYEQLLRMALAIAGTRHAAEDLVQDAFVRILLARPDPASIEHVDAYLRTVLRNLHTARLRRRAYRAEAPLSILDFDSAQFAARALTPSQWTQARHDVVAVCRYACTRRLTSKTGSLFLLRFVHDFVPSDIARVARLTRDTVDITLVRSRAEARVYLEQPARALKALGGGGLVPMSLPTVEPGAGDDDYLARVRASVFALRHGRCFETDLLQRLYASTHETAIPTPILAELVTCPRCLDHVSRLTQVPSSSERHPHDDPSSTGSAPSRRSVTTREADRTRRAEAAQTFRAVREHRPGLLRVLVNGFEVGTHEISGAAVRFTHAVSAIEPVWLVEVYSEQDVCLASLDVAPLPDAPAEQRVAVALADDRRIELVLSFLRPWPTLHLVYEDAGYPARAAAIVAEQPEHEDAEPAVHAIAAAVSPRRALRTWDIWTAWAFGRPPRLAWYTVAIAIFAWLFFFTPGTRVSAAERVWRALTAIVAREPLPAPMPRSGPAREHDMQLPALPKPPAPVSAVSSSSASALSPGVLETLEVDALTVLQARHALAGQRIQVTRTPTAVAVDGVIEGRDRHALTRALRQVPHGDALHVRLSTAADLMGTRPAGTAPPSSLRVITLDRDAVPAADDLRRALAAEAPAVAPVDAAGIGRIASDGLRGARTAFLEAATLNTLTSRFHAARASGMNDATSMKWRALLAEQTDRVARAIDQFCTRLEPVFLRDAERLTPAPSSAVADQRRLSDEAQRIVDDLRDVERITRASLAVGETAPSTIGLRDPAFWQRLAATRDHVAAFKQHVITP